ncbi:HlyD family efflux transporter periplasmic adaptor subunit [Fructobacillus sp. M1-13]|uniref:HlyD family efflux transporter periplasmic adaptor subunit n=1 Tax=Fructobacillus papyriferae TaxID=2713171 RepID=A0ABS5QN19_9LACO|nr:HlyD family efflux transporter periplasmic adaptor subunit [Fructobacillus papyriferae]MBS9334468.1 HlyD family efflux transporter periplasmic adaptor subunit [Fructobacillus papyriferae]MCD2158457.1 HlyD family efflux transporter periplasmic adaptor subunit [Fructobacillus papyriferae]
MDDQCYESVEFYHRRYGNFSNWVIWPIISLLGCLVLFLCFTKKEITIQAIGQVAPKEGKRTILSPSNSKIVVNHLKENKLVHRGDVLLRFDHAEREISSVNNQEKIKRNDEHLGLLRMYQASVESGQNRFGTQDAFGLYNQYQAYRSQIEELTLEEENGLNQISYSLDETKEKELQRQHLSRDTQQKREGLKNKTIASIKQEIQSLSDNQLDLKSNHASDQQAEELETLRAPTDGRLHLRNDDLSLTTIPAGTEMADIYPDLKTGTIVDVQFTIPAKEVKQLKIGQKVRFYANQSGPKALLLRGKVRQIDQAPIKTKEGNVYLAKAELVLSTRDYDQIRYGLEGRVSIITGKMTWMNDLRKLVFK